MNLGVLECEKTHCPERSFIILHFRPASIHSIAVYKILNYQEIQKLRTRLSYSQFLNSLQFKNVYTTVYNKIKLLPYLR